MAAAKAMLLEVLTPAAYAAFDDLREELVARARPRPRPSPPAGLRQRVRRQGRHRVLAGADPRLPRLLRATTPATATRHWLYQHNGGVFLPPWGKMEQWTLSVQHGPDDIALVVANLERFAADLSS